MAGKSKEEKVTAMEKRLKYLQGSFEKASFPELSDSLEEILYSLESAGLVVGITGESGVGKSTFINSFRELRDEDEGAAPTGRAGTSMGPTAYPHPKYANVILWDLPSIDSPDRQVKDYLEQIGISRYDFVVVMACQHFTALHARLARHIKQASKPFYFVRSRVDADLEARRLSNPVGFIDAVALERIREECLKDLKAEGVKFPKLFLLSNSHLSKYDFSRFVESLEKTLQPEKSHCLLMAAPNVSHRILERKRRALAEHLWLAAVVAAGRQAVPVPELSIACDLERLAQVLRGCCTSLGLEECSLRRAARQAEQPLESFQGLVRSPLAAAITPALVAELLEEAASRAPRLPKQLVPMASLGLSFSVVYNMLRMFVDSAAADAHKVLVRAFMSHKPTSEQGEEVSHATDS